MADPGGDGREVVPLAGHQRAAAAARVGGLFRIAGPAIDIAGLEARIFASYGVTREQAEALLNNYHTAYPGIHDSLVPLDSWGAIRLRGTKIAHVPPPEPPRDPLAAIVRQIDLDNDKVRARKLAKAKRQGALEVVSPPDTSPKAIAEARRRALLGPKRGRW